jgi:hypothetical protein
MFDRVAVFVYPGNPAAACGSRTQPDPVTARGACLACEAVVSKGSTVMERPHFVRAQLTKSVSSHTQERS